MALPTLFLVELRLAFQTCAKQHTARRQQSRPFRTLQPLFKRKDIGPGRNLKASPSADAASKKNASPSSKSLQPASDNVPTNESASSRELVPNAPKPSSVAGRKGVDVPMMIIPKAQLTPQLKLTPKEQLQIEFMTRRPPRTEAKKIFRERLLIYHGGLGRTNLLSIIKISSALVMFGFILVIVPAYYSFGSPWWTIALLLAAGLTPFALITTTSRPFVTWIHLDLPIFARQSAKAALEYARNLPENAKLHITFYRTSALTATVVANIADLVPAKSRWRPVTFEWIGNRVNKGSFLRPNPTQFYVRPHTGRGKEARDTIPGIWEVVYKRIVGVESKSVAKWRK